MADAIGSKGPCNVKLESSRGNLLLRGALVGISAMPIVAVAFMVLYSFLVGDSKNVGPCADRGPSANISVGDACLLRCDDVSYLGLATFLFASIPITFTPFFIHMLYSVNIKTEEEEIGQMMKDRRSKQKMKCMFVCNEESEDAKNVMDRVKRQMLKIYGSLIEEENDVNQAQHVLALLSRGCLDNIKDLLKQVQNKILSVEFVYQNWKFGGEEEMMRHEQLEKLISSKEALKLKDVSSKEASQWKDGLSTEAEDETFDRNIMEIFKRFISFEVRNERALALGTELGQGTDQRQHRPSEGASVGGRKQENARLLWKKRTAKKYSTLDKFHYAIVWGFYIGMALLALFLSIFGSCMSLYQVAAPAIWAAFLLVGLFVFAYPGLNKIRELLAIQLHTNAKVVDFRDRLITLYLKIFLGQWFVFLLYVYSRGGLGMGPSQTVHVDVTLSDTCVNEIVQSTQYCDHVSGGYFCPLYNETSISALVLMFQIAVIPGLLFTLDVTGISRAAKILGNGLVKFSRGLLVAATVVMVMVLCNLLTSNLNADKALCNPIAMGNGATHNVIFLILDLLNWTTDMVIVVSLGLVFSSSLIMIYLVRQDMGEGNDWHFFISHYQTTGGNQASNICNELEMRGLKVWYDQNADTIDEAAMKEGVQRSTVFVLFLSHKVFTRKFCQMEILEAKKAKKPVLLIREEDDRFGKFDPGNIEEFCLLTKDEEEGGISIDERRKREDFKEYAMNLYKDNEWLTWRRRKFEKDIVIGRMVDYLIKVSRESSRRRGGSKSFCGRLKAFFTNCCSQLISSSPCLRDEMDRRHSYIEIPE